MGTMLLAKATDVEYVSVGAIESKDVQHRLTLGREDRLTNSQQRRARGHSQQCGSLWIGDSRVHVFIRVGNFGSVISLQEHEQRTALELCAPDAAVIVGRKI